MLPQATLEGLVTAPESQLVERKISCPNKTELRKTLTAFANTTPEHEFSVVLIGIKDDGTIHGIDKTDSMQKLILEAADECYPPISFSTQIFEVKGVRLLAIVIPFSSRRPHFTGQSYVRVGSVCKQASDSQFEELITSRNSKVRKLVAYKNKEIECMFSHRQFDMPDLSGRVTSEGESYIFRVETCDLWILELRTNKDIPVYVSVEDVKISWSTRIDSLKIFVL